MEKISLERSIRISGKSLVLAIGLSLLSPIQTTYAADWKKAFDEICSKVQGADSLSQQEIEELIKESDKILPEIQTSGDPGRKVYITRLKRCRGVYEFMLDTKKNPADPKP